MTKAEATNKGREQGQGFGNGLTDDSLRLEMDAIREGIRQAANDAAVTRAGFRTIDSERAKDYIAAFSRAASTIVLERRNRLPEVVAENRKRAIEYTLDGMLRSHSDALDGFLKNFNENPLAAFEWAERAIEAAAKNDVAIRLRAIVDHPEGGHEAAVANATEQALRGARWPEHSTSQVSNVAKTYVTAAYAEFASTYAEKKS